MISKKSTFFLGIFIFLTPFFGLPSFWKTLFVALSGITLALLSIKINLIPRKSIKNKIKKEKTSSFYMENIPIYTSPIDNVEVMPEINLPEVSKSSSRKRTSSRNSANKIV